MIHKERLIKIIKNPHLSEKSSTITEKNNTIVLKVEKNATKIEIKDSVEKMFEVKVKNVNTLLIKGKTKRHGKQLGRRNNWKKAYITLKKGHNLDFSNNRSE